MVLQVYSVSQDSFSVQLVCNAVSLGGESPAALHGGAMLGVALQKTVRTGLASLLHSSVCQLCCSRTYLWAFGKQTHGHGTKYLACSRHAISKLTSF